MRVRWTRRGKNTRARDVPASRRPLDWQTRRTRSAAAAAAAKRDLRYGEVYIAAAKGCKRLKYLRLFIIFIFIVNKINIPYRIEMYEGYYYSLVK